MHKIGNMFPVDVLFSWLFWHPNVFCFWVGEFCCSILPICVYVSS